MKNLSTLIYIITLIIISFSAANASPRQEILQGPVAGEVLSVLDGDTVTMKVHVWIGQEVETSVRVNGIDAPEIKGKCERERTLAEAAKEEMSRMVSNGVRLTDIQLEKYAGRVLARLETADGTDIAAHMIEKGFARPYHGEKRRPWCG